MPENNDLIVRMDKYLATPRLARTDFSMDYEEIARAREALVREENPELISGHVFYMGPWDVMDQDKIPNTAYMVVLVVDSPADENWPGRSHRRAHPLSIAMTEEHRVAVVRTQVPTSEEIAANMRMAVATMATAIQNGTSDAALYEVLERPFVAQAIRHALAHTKR